MGDNINPEAQLAVVQGDFGRTPEFTEEQETPDPHTATEVRNLKAGIYKEAIRRNKPADSSGAVRAMIATGDELDKVDPRNRAKLTALLIQAQEQFLQYMEEEADRVRSIQNDSLRMEEVDSILETRRTVLSTGDSASHIDFWNSFGTRLEVNDPCRQKVFRSLPPSVQTEISKGLQSYYSIATAHN